MLLLTYSNVQKYMGCGFEGRLSPAANFFNFLTVFSGGFEGMQY